MDVIPSEPEASRGIYREIIVAGLATSTSQQIPRLRAFGAPLGMTGRMSRDG